MLYRHPSFQALLSQHPRTDSTPLGTDWNDPVAFSPEGVDRTQIWAMLDLSPAERLATLARWSEDRERLRAAYDASAPRPDPGNS